MKDRFPQNTSLFLLANTVKRREQSKIIASCYALLHMQTLIYPKYIGICVKLCAYGMKVCHLPVRLFPGEEQFLFMFYCANN